MISIHFPLVRTPINEKSLQGLRSFWTYFKSVKSKGPVRGGGGGRQGREVGRRAGIKAFGGMFVWFVDS